MPTGADLTGEQFYDLTFQSFGKPIQIDINRSADNTIASQTQVIRYLDLNYPAGINFKLKLTPAGFESVRYDADGDGKFESVIEPTAFAEGVLAKDNQPPSINFVAEVQNNRQMVTITAQDEAGVKIIRYSLDGKRYLPYTVPLLIDPLQTPTLRATADDNVGNRSADFTFVVPPSTPTKLAVIPILECVEENTDGIFTAKFGYENRNPVSVINPIGEDNKFNLAPHNQGQTTNFQPGRVRFSFSVTFAKGNLMWKLRGPDDVKRQITATRNSARCQ